MNPVRLASAIVANRLGRVPDPSYVTYIVTWICNAKCVFCDSWKKPSPEDLTLEEADRIFAQLKPVDAVRFSGGEPWVRQDLADLVNIVDRRIKPEVIHITTNGYLTGRILDGIRKLDHPGKVHIKVSIDGMEETHDRVRASPGGWKKAMATVKELAGLRKELGFYVGVNQTIVNRASAADYEAMKAACAAWGVHVHPVIAYEDSAIYHVEPDLIVAPASADEFKTFGDFEADEISELLARMKEDVETLPDYIEKVVKRYYLSGIANRLLHRKGSPNPRCVALRSHLRLFPNGDVAVCINNSHTTGNLRKQSFREVWHGKSAARWRDWVDKCPGCWAGCEVIPSAVYTGDIVKSLRKPAKGNRVAGKAAPSLAHAQD